MIEFNAAKSLCTCGHTGDGLDSAHATESPAPGHGRCTVPRCGCARFSWRDWTPAYATILDIALMTIATSVRLVPDTDAAVCATDTECMRPCDGGPQR